MKIDKRQQPIVIDEAEIASVQHPAAISIGRMERDIWEKRGVGVNDTCCGCLCDTNKQQRLGLGEERSVDLEEILEKSQAQKAQEAAILAADHSSKMLYQNRQVKVKTCADVYDHWRSYKKFYKRKAPKDGIEFQIDYLDTGACMSEGQRAGAPVVLALHGAPGSYKDFALLIQHLSRQSVRVIAPNFPEYMATVESGVLFRHSGDEKAAYLRDFLRALRVNKIDLLVSHSSAIFPTLLILLNGSHSSSASSSASDQDEDFGQTSQSNSDSDSEPDEISPELDNNMNVKEKRSGRNSQLAGRTRSSAASRKEARRASRVDPAGIVKFNGFNVQIKSVALFNPAGHRMPKSMKPTWLKCGAVHCYQHQMGRYWFRKLGPAFLTVVGVPVKVDNMDNVMLSATVMRNSKCRRVKKQLELLSERKIPTLLVFSENDKLIEKEIFYEMTRFMQLDQAKFDTYNDAGQPELSRSRSDDWCRVMVFKAGGHYAYSNYPKIVNQAVSELLAKQQSINEQ